MKKNAQASPFIPIEALNKSERLYQLILNNAHDLIAIHKLSDLSYEYVNPATFKVLGYSWEELVAANVLELIHPDDRVRVLTKLKEDLPKGEGQDEIRYRKKDGTYVWLEISGGILPQEADDVSIIIISRDITERKQAETDLQKAQNELESKVQERTHQLHQINEQLQGKNAELLRTEKALRASENYYRAIFENTGTAFVIVDKDLKISAANLKTAQLTGYAADELIGLNPFEKFVVAEYLPIVQEKYRLRKLDPNATPHDYQIVSKDKQGNIQNVVINVANVPDSESLIVSILDVTEQHQARIQVQASEERFRTLFENAPLGIGINRGGRNLLVNQAYLKMIGYENSSEILGEPVIKQIAPGHQEEITDKMCRREHGEALPGSYETLGQRKDGTTFPVSVEVNNILLPDGPANVGFYTDITARKQAEATLKKYVLDIQKSETYYRTIFKNTGTATMIIEEDMSISIGNEEWQKLFGYEREEIAGLKWTEFVPAVLVEKMKEYHHMRRFDDTALPRKYPIQFKNKQGDLKNGMLTVDMIPGTKSSVATFVDHTEFIRIDRAYRALSAVNMAMIHAEKEKDLLNNVCRHIVEIGDYSLAWVGYVQDDHRQMIQPVANAGKDDGYLAKLNITLKDPEHGQGPVGKAIATGKPVVSKNIKKDLHFKPWLNDAVQRGLKSAMSIPLMADKQAFGVLTIYCNEIDRFDINEEKLLIEMANNLAYAITSLRAHEDRNRTAQQLEISLDKMQRLLMQAVTSLGTALSIRDPYTAGHQRKVMKLARAIAEEMGISKVQMEGISVAATLHDIGKINVPGEILSKPGKLSWLEFEIIKTHCQAGYDIIKEIEFPWPVAEIILQHHERMNGTGYPQNLAGEGILLEARILAVADVVEAMSTHRPYRAALGMDEALDEISRNSGILYDARVVEACLKLFREKGFMLE